MSKESLGFLVEAKVKGCLDELSDRLNKTKVSIISDLILNEYDRAFCKTVEYDEYDGKRHHFKIAIRNPYYQYVMEHLKRSAPEGWVVSDEDIALYISENLECSASILNKELLK